MPRRMKPKIKKAWIRALRSGKYRQGRGYLRTQRGSYCCLGVLCDIYRKQTKAGNWEKLNEGTWGFLGETGGLPMIVARWAGLYDNAGPTPDPWIGPDKASILNDERKWRFKRIAQAIQDSL